MAEFTEAEKYQICELQSIVYTDLEYQLGLLGSYYNEDMRTRVRAQLARYTSDIQEDFVRVHPTATNYGVEINAGDVKSDIIKKIGILLQLPGYGLSDSSVGAFQMEVVKG